MRGLPKCELMRGTSRDCPAGAVVLESRAAGRFRGKHWMRPEGPFQPAGVVNAMDLAIARGHAHGYYYRSFAKIFGDLQKVA